ncbi:HAD family hydrolase [Alkaliphilus crotonatoxidans]
MINTILFDLDGTLLPLEMEEFLKHYFDALENRFGAYFPKGQLTKLVWASTKYMVQNIDSNKTNEEAFFEDFFTRTHHKQEEIYPIFNDFYLNDFIKVKKAVGQNEKMIEAVKVLKKKGYTLIVATNPIFPYEAVRQRIAWAGLMEEDFTLITSFEKMHFCKPQLNYYKEILEKIERLPQECMMVGNDLQEDMVAKGLGMKTYLIENHKIGQSNEDNIDYMGNYDDFYEFALALPEVK